MIDVDRTDASVVFQDRLKGVDHIGQKAILTFDPLDIEQPASAHVFFEQLFLLVVETDPVFRSGDRVSLALEQKVYRVVEQVFLVEISVAVLIDLNEDVRAVAVCSGQGRREGSPWHRPRTAGAARDVEVPPGLPAAVEVGNDRRRLPARPGEILDAQQVESFAAPRRVRPAVLVRRQLALLDECQGFGRRPGADLLEGDVDLGGLDGARNEFGAGDLFRHGLRLGFPPQVFHPRLGKPFRFRDAHPLRLEPPHGDVGDPRPERLGLFRLAPGQGDVVECDQVQQ